MSEHKFTTFEKVMVRNDDLNCWNADFFSHIHNYEKEAAVCVGGTFWQCIPYNYQTKHLLGTSDPYDPHKPTSGYKWGDKVEIEDGGIWHEALFVEDDGGEGSPIAVLCKPSLEACWVGRDEIRPLEPSHD